MDDSARSRIDIPGGAARVLNQGSSLTCTCHALANAIADKLNEEHNIDVDQKIIAKILVNYNQHVGAVWPDIFDNYGPCILTEDRNSKENEWISIKIKTVKRVERFINGEKHLLSYLSKDGHHCVFLKERKGNLYECVNSWGEYDPYPLVPVENPGNKLWIVQVEFKPASNSNNAVDEATLQESDQDVGQIGDITRTIENVAHKADIEARNHINRTPLHDAACNNSTEVAQLLITQKADIEARDEYNQTPLHEAASNNSTEVAKLLITHKADIEARDENNQTPLHLAACNKSTEVAKLLIKQEADIKARDINKQTPLHMAAFSNSTEVAKLLIKQEADIKARDIKNQTPLHLAAFNNSTEVAQLLTTHEADIEVRDEFNRTPLHEAPINNST